MNWSYILLVLCQKFIIFLVDFGSRWSNSSEFGFIKALFSFLFIIEEIIIR